MKICKQLLFVLLLLLLTPLVAATVSLTCSPSSVQPGDSVACTVISDTVLSNVGTLQFTINGGTLFDIASISGLTGVTFNSNTGQGTYTNAAGVTFNGGQTMFTINLRAKAGASGTGSISFSRFVVRDASTTNIINTGSLTSSNQVTVGTGAARSPAGGACTTTADCQSGLACGNGICGTPCANRVECSGGLDCIGGACRQPSSLRSCNENEQITVNGVAQCSCDRRSDFDREDINGKCSKVIDEIRKELKATSPTLLQKIANIVRALKNYFGSIGS